MNGDYWCDHKQTMLGESSKHVATAIWRVGPTSWGSYCPLGLVAARMVHLVFSLHTSPPYINNTHITCEQGYISLLKLMWCLWMSSLTLETTLHTIPTREQNVYLGYTDGLLLHGFMDASSVMFTNTVEFIYSDGWGLIMHQRTWSMSFYLCSRGLHLPEPELLPPTATHHCPEERSGVEIPLS